MYGLAECIKDLGFRSDGLRKVTPVGKGLKVIARWFTGGGKFQGEGLDMTIRGCGLRSLSEVRWL